MFFNVKEINLKNINYLISYLLRENNNNIDVLLKSKQNFVFLNGSKKTNLFYDTETTLLGFLLLNKKNEECQYLIDNYNASFESTIQYFSKTTNPKYKISDYLLKNNTSLAINLLPKIKNFKINDLNLIYEVFNGNDANYILSVLKSIILNFDLYSENEKINIIAYGLTSKSTKDIFSNCVKNDVKIKKFFLSNFIPLIKEHDNVILFDVIFDLLSDDDFAGIQLKTEEDKAFLKYFLSSVDNIGKINVLINLKLFSLDDIFDIFISNKKVNHLNFSFLKENEKELKKFINKVSFDKIKNKAFLEFKIDCLNAENNIEYFFGEIVKENIHCNVLKEYLNDKNNKYPQKIRELTRDYLLLNKKQDLFDLFMKEDLELYFDEKDLKKIIDLYDLNNVVFSCSKLATEIINSKYFDFNKIDNDNLIGGVCYRILSTGNNPKDIQKFNDNTIKLIEFLHDKNFTDLIGQNIAMIVSAGDERFLVPVKKIKNINYKNILNDSLLQIVFKNKKMNYFLDLICEFEKEIDLNEHFHNGKTLAEILTLNPSFREQPRIAKILLSSTIQESAKNKKLKV